MLQSSEYIDTRLFRSKTTQSRDSDGGHKRGGYRNMSEKALFGKTGTEYLGEPPTNSLYDITLHASVTDDKAVASGWITVYGNKNMSIKEIVDYFITYGEIIYVEQHSGNWVSINFSKHEDAEKAANENKKPFLLQGKYSVFARLGRMKHDINQQKPDQIFVEDIEDAASSQSLLDQIKDYLISLVTVIF